MYRAPTHIDRIYTETGIAPGDLTAFAQEHGHAGPLWPVALVELLAESLGITLTDVPVLGEPVRVSLHPKNPRFLRVLMGESREKAYVRLKFPWQKKFRRDSEILPEHLTAEEPYDGRHWLYTGPAPTTRRARA